MDVDLKLVADSSNYIRALKEAREAQIKLKDDIKDLRDMESTAIRRIEKDIDSLSRKKIGMVKGKDLDEINKRLHDLKTELKESKETLKEFDQEVRSAEKSKTKMMGTLKKYLGVAALVTAAYKGWRVIVASTKTTTEGFQRTMEGLTAQMDVFKKSLAVGDFENFWGRMKRAKQAAKDYSDAMAEIADSERSLAVMRAEAAEELYEAERRMRDISLTPQERRAALEEYMAIQVKFLEEEKRISDERVAAAQEMVGSKINLEGEEIAGMIKFYNENRAIREAALRYEAEYIKAQEQYNRDFDFVHRQYTGRTLKQEQEKLKIRSDAIWENKQLMIQEMSDTHGFNETQIREFLTFVNRYNMATKEELDIVADALQKKSQAYSSEARITKERQRQMNMIVRAESAEEKKRQSEIEKTRNELLKGDEEFANRLAAIAAENQQEWIGMLEGETAILEQLHHNKQALLQAEEQMLKDYHERAKRQLEEGIITEAELEERLRVTSLKQIHEAIEILEIEARAAIAKIIEDDALAKQQAQQKEDDEVLKYRRQFLETELDVIGAGELEKLNLRLSFMREDRANLTHESKAVLEVMRLAMDEQIKLIEAQIKVLEDKTKEFSLADFLGISQEYIDAGKMAAKEFGGVLDDIYNQRVKDAERTRYLLDRSIQETQMALNAELALLEAGYASNVQAKQEEIALLQEERDKAQKEEERAIAAKKKLDTIQQTSSLVTASANIYQSLSPLGPAGIGVAVALIATMFAGFLKAKAEASKITLETGGLIDEFGTVKGKRHSRGGERLLDHIEVEDGEKIGVFNRMASEKYDKQIRFAVQEFNKGRMPVFKMPAGTKVINNTMDVRKLHDIDAKLGVMNDFFQKNGIVTYSGNARIESRRNFTRVVRNG